MKVHDNGIDREATPQEIAEHEEFCRQAEASNQRLAERNASRTSAKNKLSALGLTDDEINALLGV